MANVGRRFKQVCASPKKRPPGSQPDFVDVATACKDERPSVGALILCRDWEGGVTGRLSAHRHEAFVVRFPFSNFPSVESQ